MLLIFQAASVLQKYFSGGMVKDISDLSCRPHSRTTLQVLLGGVKEKNKNNKVSPCLLREETLKSL
jgi:hypothetical protein